jgi:hypothetical protein
MLAACNFGSAEAINLCGQSPGSWMPASLAGSNAVPASLATDFVERIASRLRDD